MREESLSNVNREASCKQSQLDSHALAPVIPHLVATFTAFGDAVRT